MASDQKAVKFLLFLLSTPANKKVFLHLQNVLTTTQDNTLQARSQDFAWGGGGGGGGGGECV